MKLHSGRVEMVPFLWRSWPDCPDLSCLAMPKSLKSPSKPSLLEPFRAFWSLPRPCFAYGELEETKRKCLVMDACDGFSFSAQRMGGGLGAGCFKAQCRGDEVNGTELLALPAGPLRRGAYGYWAKRRWPVKPAEQRLTRSTRCSLARKVKLEVMLSRVRYCIITCISSRSYEFYTHIASRTNAC